MDTAQSNFEYSVPPDLKSQLRETYAVFHSAYIYVDANTCIPASQLEKAGEKCSTYTFYRMIKVKIVVKKGLTPF